jgi:CelD/BcsL family acetyltransferase involved in cellulose biosynthesis
LKLILYRDATGFAELRDEWNSLLRRSRFDTIFLTYEWQTTWWQSLGAARGVLYLLACREDGHLVGILPLYLSGPVGSRTLSVVGCVEVSDYLDLIVEAGREDEVYEAFLAWLAGPEAPDWDCVELCNQPAVSLTHARIPNLVSRWGWAAEVVQEDVCPIVDLPRAEEQPGVSAVNDGDDPAQQADRWDLYLEGLDKKQRHEIRRKLRRVEREAPDSRVRLAVNDDSLVDYVERFIALHRQSTGDKDAFMTPAMQAFFHAVARTTAEAGWLQLSFLEIAGQPVASMFCFDYGNEILLYNSGYDPQAYPQLSSGWVLLAHVIQQAINTDHRRIDFLQGDEDYKYRFGGVDTPVYRTLIRRL